MLMMSPNTTSPANTAITTMNQDGFFFGISGGGMERFVRSSDVLEYVGMLAMSQTPVVVQPGLLRAFATFARDTPGALPADRALREPCGTRG